MDFEAGLPRVGAAVASAMVPIAIVGSATAAGAAPFECTTPTVYIAQGIPTQLYTLTYSPGSATLTPIGTAMERYNAIAFNTDDGFIYAVSEPIFGADEVIRIDDTGAITPTA